MVGTLTINGFDAYTKWGVVLGDGSLNALMTPAPVKAAIENKSRLIDGKQVVSLGKLDARDVSLTLYIRAGNQMQFNQRLAAFITAIRQGTITLETKFEPNVVYRLNYSNCTQFSQCRGRLGKFVVRFNEPNPANRQTS